MPVEFPGISNILAADFPLSRGVTPNVCTLTVVPDPTVTLDVPPGELKLADNLSGEVRFSGCAVESANFFQALDGSWRWHVQILDRRRLWKAASISGEYNVRLSSGLVIESTRKSAQELIALCLAACGEGNADVSEAPQSVYPYVRWRDARADLALADLCERTACEICPTVDDKFRACALGVGAELEDLSAKKHPPVRYVPRRVPAIIRLVGGASIFQTKLLLQAIGEETSGDEKLVADLSYKPSISNGWTYELPFTLPNTGDSVAADQRAALETVWRRYRILSQAQGGLAVPGCEEQIDAIRQYLPIANFLVSSGLDLDLTPRVLRPYIEGDFWPYSHSSESATSIRYTGAWNLLADRGEVEFQAPIFGLSSGTVIAPTLYLTCAYYVIGQNGDVARLRREQAATGDGVEVLRRPELFASFVTEYSTTSVTSPTVTTNTLAQAQVEADAYLALFARKYQDPRCGECTYAGILPRGLDGKIAQVTWRMRTKQPPSTHVCLNEELNVFAVGPKERRRREKLEAIT